MKNKKRRGQVWIETVIYTIIGLALIGTVLAFIAPKISETKDRITIEQSIEAMQTLDAKVQEVIGEGTGSRRVTNFNLKKGELIIDPVVDTISLKINDLNYLYSEPGAVINFDRVELQSRKNVKTNEVELILRYSATKYNNLDNIEKITAASTPHRISIENKKQGNVDYINFLVER